MRNKFIPFLLLITIFFAAVIGYLNKTRQVGCHFKAHVTTFEEVKRNPAKWKKVLAKYPASACTGGYLMGVLEGHKAFDPSFKLDEKTSVEVCERPVKKNSGKKTELTCMHTMGHLFLTAQKGKLDQAINLCRKVQTKYQDECFAGVFMEKIYRRNLIAHNLASAFDWNEKSLEQQKAICNQYSGRIAKACWREISHMFVHLSNRNPKIVYDMCNQAKSEIKKNECYIHAVGIMTLTSNNKNLCQPYKDSRNLLLRCESMMKNNNQDL